MLYCKNSFVHSIDFLVGGRFFALFCIGQVPPCILELEIRARLALNGSAITGCELLGPDFIWANV